MNKLVTLFIFGFTVNLLAQKPDLLPISTTTEIVKHKYYTFSYSEKKRTGRMGFLLTNKSKFNWGS